MNDPYSANLEPRPVFADPMAEWVRLERNGRCTVNDAIENGPHDFRLYAKSKFYDLAVNGFGKYDGKVFTLLGFKD